MESLFWHLFIKRILIVCQRLQNKSVKVLNEVNYFDNATLYFAKFNILKISEIYHIKIAMLMFRHTYIEAPALYVVETSALQFQCDKF